MPAYNAALQIAGTLRAALAQTYPALEILVVDDGSVDDTARIADAFARDDPRVRMLRQPNAGVAAARNAGIRAARGTLVAPLDADDAWHPEKIARQVARLEQAGPEVGVVYTDFQEVDSVTGERLDAPGHALPEGNLADVLVYRNPIPCASTPLVRRECLEQVGGYDASLRALGGQGCEDWDLYLRLAEATRFAVVPEVLVTYRRVAGSMSTNPRQMATSYAVMMERLRTRRPGIDAALWRRSRQRHELYLAGIYRQHGARARYVWHLLRALQADPGRAVVWAARSLWR